MPRRGECIYKRKDGRWEARYVKAIRPDGKKVYGSVYANTYRDVKDKQMYYMTTPAREVKCTINIQVSDLMIRWLSGIRNQVKLSSYRKYECLVLNHIIPELGKIPLHLIDREMIEAFAESQMRQGRVDGGGLSAKTVNDILLLLSLAFDYAQEEYNFSMPKIRFIRESRKDTRVLSVEEQEVLTKYLIEDMDLFKFGILLALYTGIRIGELCALQWEDITESSLYISKTMQRLKDEDGKTKVVVGDPKSNSSRRCVPLPSFLLPYIQQFQQKEGYILKTQKKPYAEPRCVQIRFKKIAEECGYDDVTFHTLRHTFATRCIEAGFDPKSLAEILGHADVKTTLNRYVHSSFDWKQQNMDKLSWPCG